jgi:hypothetical protein
MAFWNPKSYNPATQSFAQQMLANAFSQGAGRTPAESIGGAAQKIIAALMMRGQNKAYKRAEKNTLADIMTAQQLQRQGSTSMLNYPGSTGNILPMDVPIGTIDEGETIPEWKQRKQSELRKALLKSEIPEYKAMGNQMLQAELQARLPEFSPVVTKDGDVLAFDKNSGATMEVHNGDPEWHQVDPEKDLYIGTDLVRPGNMEGKHNWQPVPGIHEQGGQLGTLYVDKNNLEGEKKFIPGRIKTGGQTINLNLPGEQLTTATAGELQTRLITAKDQLRELGNLVDMYEPEYLTVGGKAKQFFRRLKAWAGFKLSDEELEKGLSQAEFQGRAAQYANLQIKFITGAQMSFREADRLLKGIPNPDDDPLTFGAKLNFVYETTTQAIQAYEKMLSQGLKGREMKDLSPEERKAIEDSARAYGDAVISSRMTVYDRLSGQKGAWEEQGQIYGAKQRNKLDKLYAEEGTIPGAPGNME